MHRRHLWRGVQMIPNPGTPEETIHNALAETIENMIFEEVVLEEVKDNILPENIEGCWWAKIDLLDPPLGDVVLIIRKDLMIRYTEAIFGMMEEEMPDNKQVKDNIGELLNTICGRMLALKLPPDQLFDLGVPEIGEGELPKLNHKFKSVNCYVGDNMAYLLAPECFWEKI